MECDDHHDGGAVRVGDDSAGTVQRIGGVALGHDERHVLVHAEGGGVVNHDGTEASDVGCKLFGSACAGGGEGDVHVFEVVVVLEQFHFHFLTAEDIFSSCASL